MKFDSSSVLPDDLKTLWKQADDLWEQEQNQDAFYSYVSADYELVYDALAKLAAPTTNFLEWGSGLGLVTIMASRLGFSAFGIEAEEQLLDYSVDFATEYAPQAQFASGSFIPDGFVWSPSAGDESVRTVIDVPDAYDKFDMQLQDFDIVYAYPWPTEHELYHNILKQFARPGTLFLSYDAREGIDLIRF